jgi:hypothetical protein
LVFEKKRQFFRRKLAKIAENCDQNNNPWSMSELSFSPYLKRASLMLLQTCFCESRQSTTICSALDLSFWKPKCHGGV